ELRDVGAEAAVNRGRHWAGRAVAGVDDDLDRTPELAHVLDDVVLVFPENRLLLARPFRRTERPRFEAAAHVLDLVAVQRLAAEAELEAVVVGRVVAARDLDAAVEPPMEDREVHERRRDGPELDHVEPGRPEAADQRGRVRVRREPAVAADAHALRP